MHKPALIGIAMLCLSACAASETPMRDEPLGDFRLGHNIVIADNVQEGPFSRDLVEAEIELGLQRAVEERLGRFDGDGLYHIGIYVGVAVLAQPGIPILYTPASTFVFDVSVFDNETRQRLTPEPHRMFVGEGIDNATLLGSGLTRSRQEQIANISRNAAGQIEEWLRENEEWFTPRPGQVRVPFGDDEVLPDGAEAAIRPEGA